MKKGPRRAAWGHGGTGGPPSARAIPRSLTRPAASPISPHPQSPQGAVRWRRVAVRAEARRLPGLGRHLRWPDVAELCVPTLAALPESPCRNWAIQIVCGVGVLKCFLGTNTDSERTNA